MSVKSKVLMPLPDEPELLADVLALDALALLLDVPVVAEAALVGNIGSVKILVVLDVTCIGVSQNWLASRDLLS